MTRGRAQNTRHDAGIVAIDTEFTAPLQDASHLIIEQSSAAFVDTGVNASVPLLLDALDQHDIDASDVDYVFLTHVHLDHAGGAGRLLCALPNARCVVHPRGARHMIDPTHLVAGATAVYGEDNMQRLYGVIEPIDSKRIVIAEDEEWFELGGRPLQTIHTEGHARHHYVLNDPRSRSVFTGDSFGISYREFDTAAGAFIFASATPVQFDPVEAHRSVDRILTCEPEQAYLTHFSRVDGLARLGGELHDSIDAYVSIAREHAEAPDRIEALESGMFAYFAERLAGHGYVGDRAVMSAALELDVFLNARGLDVWLDRQQRN